MESVLSVAHVRNIGTISGDVPLRAPVPLINKPGHPVWRGFPQLGVTLVPSAPHQILLQRWPAHTSPFSPGSKNPEYVPIWLPWFVHVTRSRLVACLRRLQCQAVFAAIATGRSTRAYALPGVSHVVDAPRAVGCVWVREPILEKARLLWRCIQARDAKLEHMVNDPAICMRQGDRRCYVVRTGGLQAGRGVVQLWSQVRRRGVAPIAGTTVMARQRGNALCVDSRHQQVQSHQRPHASYCVYRRDGAAAMAQIARSRPSATAREQRRRRATRDTSCQTVSRSIEF